ncbi:NAD-dependent epimerase/dehydratase family protein [Gammaproteobacteria bacterium]|jgi:nucleoside-diphosphate-sugar epimerase|nr:NAD-dependent epimerase/dehydratase family protein [Gammaproteobacteria bacterium]
MAFYLIGGRGRLGRSIKSEYANSELISLDRSIYEDWSREGSSDKVSRYLERNVDEKSTVFVASGLLDPSMSEEELFKVNYMLPKNMIDAASKHDIEIITFGTVMEGLIQSKNPYLRSKTELKNYVEMMASGQRSVKHIQLHTHYGIGFPSSFMFLGQMLHAIKANLPFRMTSGRQLREYHHLEDEVIAIRMITESSIFGVINLSHGEPISLREIAENVFNAHGKTHLLHLGALPEPAEENYDQIFQMNEVIHGAHFREALPNINAYIKNCYVS